RDAALATILEQRWHEMEVERPVITAVGICPLKRHVSRCRLGILVPPSHSCPNMAATAAILETRRMPCLLDVAEDAAENSMKWKAGLLRSARTNQGRTSSTLLCFLREGTLLGVFSKANIAANCRKQGSRRRSVAWINLSPPPGAGAARQLCSQSGDKMASEALNGTVQELQKMHKEVCADEDYEDLQILAETALMERGRRRGVFRPSGEDEGGFETRVNAVSLTMAATAVEGMKEHGKRAE
ncbi:Isocitrate dehydrogenase [NAD] regulatory subunit 1 mitochondrial, partial [Dissostichus eleginoides]